MKCLRDFVAPTLSCGWRTENILSMTFCFNYLDETMETELGLSLTPPDLEYVRYTNEGHFVSCNGTEPLAWFKPDGSEVGHKGRVHVESVDGQLRLIFDSVRKKDHGTWVCLSGTAEKSFVLNVYGNLFEIKNSVHVHIVSFSSNCF